ncbi:MAG: Holliday junction branch migration protein RuvA [Candidatus Pacebacteria bacterium]|nr:Holliday junction branch migration protein RuvA [Candidatus Paceibacterota bacterium]
MIAYLKGKIIFKNENFIILLSGDIGYKVFMLSCQDKIDDEVEFFTYLNVKEDALTLYGFSSYNELELFEHLISISGIGPKAGLGILSLADPETVKVAIAKGDSSILTRVSGIGKKTAERVVLELRNKFSSLDGDDVLQEKSKEINDHTDVIEALISLGYSAQQAKKALANIPSEIKDVSERIKMALKEIGKK